MIVDIKMIFVIFLTYQVIFSKFLPIITLVTAINLHKQTFYIEQIATKVSYLILIGGLIDIILYTQIHNSLFQINNHISIPISFLATFLPMYIVYIYEYYRKQ